MAAREGLAGGDVHTHRTIVPSESASESVAGALAAFEHATSRHGAVVNDYRIAGRLVRLRAVGSRLVEVVHAGLAHLLVSAGGSTRDETSPELTIALWDGAASGVGMPPVAWAREATSPDQATYLRGSKIQASYNPSLGVLSLIDVDAGLAWCHVADASALPRSDLAALLRFILNAWATRHGLHFLHAAAVGTEAAGVLVVGPSGAGKSTVALSCLGSRLRSAGDDFILMSSTPTPFAHSVHGTARLWPDHLRQRLPSLVSAAVPPSTSPTAPLEEKAFFQVAERFPGFMIAGFPIRALLVPKRSARPETVIRPTTGAAAVLAGAPSAVFVDAGRPAALAALAALARVVPTYTLDMGPDVSGIPVAIEALLRQLEVA